MISFLCLRDRIKSKFFEAGALRSSNIPKGSGLLIAAHSHDFVSRAVRNRLQLGAIGASQAPRPGMLSSGLLECESLLPAARFTG